MEAERFVPGMRAEIWYEHWHRYHFAALAAKGKRALDIACGEGYGAALLARHAAHVTGVDVAAEVLAQARNRYGSLANLEFIEGRCEAIPLGNASIDLAVSFETIEHIAAPEKLVDEMRRVLRPDGMAIISTPNRPEYSERRNYRNVCHIREFDEGELTTMLRERFGEVFLLGQRVDAYSAIWPISMAPEDVQLLDAKREQASDALPGVADPMYFIAICGHGAAAVAEQAQRFSLLSDREHWLLEDYQALQRKVAELEAHVERIEAAYVASQQQMAAIHRERGALAHASGTAPSSAEWRKG